MSATPYTSVKYRYKSAAQVPVRLSVPVHSSTGNVATCQFFCESLASYLPPYRWEEQPK